MESAHGRTCRRHREGQTDHFPLSGVSLVTVKTPKRRHRLNCLLTNTKRSLAHTLGAVEHDALHGLRQLFRVLHRVGLRVHAHHVLRSRRSTSHSLISPPPHERAALRDLRHDRVNQRLDRLRSHALRLVLVALDDRAVLHLHHRVDATSHVSPSPTRADSRTGG